MFKAPWKQEFWNINSAKRFHGLIGMILFSFLFVSALTGVTYRFLKAVVGLEGESVEWLMTIHAFKYSKLTTVFYVHIMLITVVLLILGGSYSFIRSKYLWVKYKLTKHPEGEDFEMYEQMDAEGNQRRSGEYPLDDAFLEEESVIIPERVDEQIEDEEIKSI
jgi:hypothetical protein